MSIQNLLFQDFTLSPIVTILMNNRMQRIPIDKEYEILEYFRQTYYRHANVVQHNRYLIFLYEFREENNRFPTDSEFFNHFKSFCMCSYSLLTLPDDYVRAMKFFMKHLGDHTIIRCDEIYFHYEFCSLEHRDPNSLGELESYITRVALSILNPDHAFPTATSSNPVASSTVDRLRSTVSNIDKQTCSICQEDIANQPAVKLDCNHYFHAEDKDCCETGTIFTWFQNNKKCPTCRAEIL